MKTIDTRRRLVVAGLVIAPAFPFGVAQAFWQALFARLIFGSVTRQAARSGARVMARSVGRQVTRNTRRAGSKRDRNDNLITDAYDLYSKGGNIVKLVRGLQSTKAWNSTTENTASVVLANQGNRAKNSANVILTMRDITNDDYLRVIFDPVEVPANSAFVMETRFPPGLLPGVKAFELKYSRDGSAGKIFEEIVVAAESRAGSRRYQEGISPKSTAPVGEAGKIFRSINE
uniref:Uncharacterized protein n=1 Tax=Candidatus Kentrum sp. UNK TaxID=2126344 RepID=A0A451ATT4_9GAMM|nr:MAG: hypothetical protein BECKUNK1418G_GA0071005_101315 [Candidatus Kentron sp. UNK]VFK69459.1 MAG: hypothetical protein BECKUNK1418H_GA0071006_101415 [Candidatus Kentron sp. UNK]